jgi:chlorite dismutase
MDTRYSECLGWFYRRHPEKIGDYIKSVSPKQIQCKQWLLKELMRVPRDFKNIQLYGGWYGYPLIDMLDRAYNLKTLTNIDCDKFATSVCFNFKNYFKNDFAKTSTRDLETTSGIYKDVDLVINTSSEHMNDLPQLIKNKLYSSSCVFALQSNNMFDLEEHTNCVNSHEELVQKSGLNKILYSGKMTLDNYERYMVIGLF